MKPLKHCYWLFICFSIAMGVAYPSHTISAEQPLPEKEEERSPLILGNLTNGVQYTIVPSEQLKDAIWIKLTCAIPDLEKKSTVPLLTQHALFYETEQCDRHKIVQRLHSLGLDIEADSYLISEGLEQGLQFSISASSPQKIQEALSLFSQFILKPTLTNESVELARNHLLDLCKTEDEKLSFQTIPASDVRKFHAHWYKPENMHLTIIGRIDAKESLPLVSESFGSDIATSDTIALKEGPEESNEQNMLNELIDKVEWTTDAQSHVVDGKIWMNEPNWINQSNNGKMLGAVLTLIGIGGMIVAFPYFVSAAIIGGGLSTGTGLYFLTSDYLKDPYYIESSRKDDLQYGCAYAYKKGRVGTTLTPYERRASFLQEMVDRPEKLPKLPILLLADLYQLNDPVIAEIFTVDEFNALSNLKREFIQERNQFKFYKEILEKELASATAPYGYARDASLLHAQNIYNQNYFVVAKENFKRQREASIADIEKAFKDQEISQEEMEEMIKQAHAYYEAFLKAPDQQTGLHAAELNLAQAELEIQATYTYHVELAKQLIKYQQRKDYYQQGEHSLINYYNQALRNLLGTFPVYYTIFPDYLDLRNL